MSTKSRRNQQKRTRKPVSKVKSARVPRDSHPERARVCSALAAKDKPLSFDALAEALMAHSPRDLDRLGVTLEYLERDGVVMRNRRGAYGLTRKMDLVRGLVRGHREGHGFLVPEDGTESLFLHAKDMRSLMDGDRAVVRPTGGDWRGRPAGALVEVLERNTHTLVGRFYQESGVGFVRPDNRSQPHDILIPADESGGAAHAEIVSVRLIEQPSDHNQPIGRVEEVMGGGWSTALVTEAAIRSYGVPNEWPDAALREAQAWGSEVPKGEGKHREDLTAVPLVTIDGEDARDFDDAVFCRATNQGWRLIVAIADVSAYVPVGGALDGEALKRGTSVYFPDRVVPMLPETLSNGLCSLMPEVERLCFAVEMLVDRAGQIKRSRFFEAIMRSHARLTYAQVAAAVVDREPETRKAMGPLLPHLEELQRLYGALRSARGARGALDIDTVETRFVFNETGQVTKLEPYQRNDAHRFIEEAMIAANVAAARYLARHKVPTLFRVHHPPPEDKLEELRRSLLEMGLRLPGGSNPNSKNFAALLERAARRPDGDLVQMMVLRSMAQAVYGSDNAGHFGLGLANYLHFTSPIRRYPDIIVHRGIKHALAHSRAEQGWKGFGYALEDLDYLGRHCSTTERRADDATRDVTLRLKCELLLAHVNEEFEGRISGVTSFGLFVTLRQLHVDGLIHISALGNEYFHYDAAAHRLEGEHSGTMFKLGEPISVRIVSVDVDERRVDFEPLESTDSKPGEGRRTRRRPRSSAGHPARRGAHRRRAR